LAVFERIVLRIPTDELRPCGRPAAEDEADRRESREENEETARRRGTRHFSMVAETLCASASSLMMWLDGVGG
jgi:hypothetical protein